MLQGLVNRVRMYLAEATHQLQWQAEDLPVAELLASFTIEFDDKNDKKHDYLVKRLANGSDFPPILIFATSRRPLRDSGWAPQNFSGV